MKKKSNFVISIFCSINKLYNDDRGTILKFLVFVRLYHSQQCHHARGELVLVCVRNIVLRR